MEEKRRARIQFNVKQKKKLMGKCYIQNTIKINVIVRYKKKK